MRFYPDSETRLALATPVELVLQPSPLKAVEITACVSPIWAGTTLKDTFNLVEWRSSLARVGVER